MPGKVSLPHEFVSMDSPMQTLIQPHVQDLGGFTARRLLPSEQRMMVGPFIFFDHLGPAVFSPGQGVDVIPLSKYLFCLRYSHAILFCAYTQ